MKIVNLKQTAVALAHALLPDPRFSDVDKCYDALLRARVIMREEDVLRLERWGLECCGGAGDQINPADGKRWGEQYFVIAKMLDGLPVIEP